MSVFDLGRLSWLVVARVYGSELDCRHHPLADPHGSKFPTPAINAHVITAAQADGAVVGEYVTHSG